MCRTDAAGSGDRGARDLTGARFQPWLLSGAALSVFPALVAADVSPAVLLIAGLAVVTGIGAWVAERRGRLASSDRRRTALFMAVVALVALVVVLELDVGGQPAAYLLLASSLVVTVAALPRVWWRVGLQLGILIVVVRSMFVAGRSAPDALFVGALLVGTAVLADAFVRRMRSARSAALRAEAEARNRAELLDAVRTLPGSSVIDAVDVVCRALHSLGFDGAAVVRRRGEQLVELHGAVAAGSALDPIDQELVRSALAEGRTVVRAGTPTAAAIATPVRVEGRAVGVVLGAWDAPHDATDEEIEILEVLASHLGGALAAGERLARQAELLERMGALDRMRRGLLAAVSDEVRDPLTIIRGAGQVLASHADRIGAEQRLALLGRMCTQAADLRELVDVLLDFSRSQSRRHDPTVGPTDVIELLGQVMAENAVRIVPPLEELTGSELMVEADAFLIRSAIDLLVARRPGPETRPAAVITLESGETDLTLRIAVAGESPASHLVRSLATQLLEAGGARLEPDVVLGVRLRRLRAPVPAPVLVAASGSGDGSTDPRTSA